MDYFRAEELERNSRNQVKDEQELAFQEAQLRDQQREVRVMSRRLGSVIMIIARPCSRSKRRNRNYRTR